MASLALALASAAQGAIGGSTADRIAFSRYRLLETALAQAKTVSGNWDPGQRDCAGLVRFLYRQAIMGPADIWRDHAGAHVAFVSAGELVGYNFSKQSDLFDPSKAETGDLLVFHRPDHKPEDAWHLMMLLKPQSFTRQEWLAIYHNGEHGSKGQVRVVSLNDLMTTVHGEWRPSSANPAFRGVYRWNEWMQAAKTR